MLSPGSFPTQKSRLKPGKADKMAVCKKAGASAFRDCGFKHRENGIPGTGQRGGAA